MKIIWNILSLFENVHKNLFKEIFGVSSPLNEFRNENIHTLEDEVKLKKANDMLSSGKYSWVEVHLSEGKVVLCNTSCDEIKKGIVN